MFKHQKNTSQEHAMSTIIVHLFLNTAEPKTGWSWPKNKALAGSNEQKFKMNKNRKDSISSAELSVTHRFLPLLHLLLPIQLSKSLSDLNVYWATVVLHCNVT